jgi:hypothetical protein
MDQAGFVRDCVVTIAADDYENFELIFEEAKCVAAIRGIVVNEAEVAEALRRAIGDGLMDAYVLSPQPPHSTKVEYDPDRLHELWFYVTPHGKSTAKGIPELSGEFPSR